MKCKKTFIFYLLSYIRYVVLLSDQLYVLCFYRAQDAIDKVIEITPELRGSPCRTLSTHFIGYEGYSENLQARLIQKYNVTSRVARRLARAYGGRAVDVIQIAREISDAKKAAHDKKSSSGKNGNGNGDPELAPIKLDLEPEETLMEAYAGPEALLVNDYPVIEAEIVFGVRHDWVVRPEDFLARRTRLAFLNKDATLRAIPRVVQLMAKELKWNRARQSAEVQRCLEYMRHFGGSKPAVHEPTLRLATKADLVEVFRKATGKATHAAGLTRDTLQIAGELLNHTLSEEEIEDCIQFSEQTEYTQKLEGVVSYEAFSEWWNSERLNPGLVAFKARQSANTGNIEGSGAMFG